MMLARFLTGVTFFSSILCMDYQAAGHGQSLIDLRIASDTAVPGYVPMTGISDTVFYIERFHVLSDSDIQAVSVDVTKGRIHIKARLAPAAKSRYRALLKGHAGDRLAVILNGELLGAPIIARPPSDVEPSSDPYVDIVGELPDSTAERIKARITARWPADRH